jgi:enoyl-CoA hydratase/carnithine racemase
MFHVTRDGAVAELRYEKPPRALLTSAALAQLRLSWRALEKDPTVRVIVLRGSIAHTELDEIDAMLRDAARVPRWLIAPLLLLLRLAAPLLRRFPFLVPERATPLQVLFAFDAIQRSPKITVAVLDGLWIGGGLELALCFDYRIALSGTVGCPEVRMGILPGFGGSQRLARLLGAAPARELLLTGDVYDAAEAKALGIVSRLARDEGEVRHFVADLAQRPPLAVAAIKRALADDVWPDLFREMREVMRVAGSRDVVRGLSAYRAALAAEDRPGVLVAQMSRVEFEGR